MFTRIRRATLFALYQTSIAFGILLLPVAILTRRVGVTLPLHRFIERLADAYDDRTE